MKIDIGNYEKIKKMPVNSSTGLYCECGSVLIIKKGYRKFLQCCTCNKKHSITSNTLVNGKLILEV